MNIDLLIKMANEITSFWEGEAGQDKAATEVATHLSAIGSRACGPR